MLLATLSTSLLENLLIGERAIRAAKRIISADQNF